MPKSPKPAGDRYGTSKPGEGGKRAQGSILPKGGRRGGGGDHPTEWLDGLTQDEQRGGDLFEDPLRGITSIPLSAAFGASHFDIGGTQVAPEPQIAYEVRDGIPGQWRVY